MALKCQRSLDSYESNDETKNIRPTQDGSIHCFSTTNCEEVDEEDAEEKTLLKGKEKNGTISKNLKVENKLLFIKNV